MKQTLSFEKFDKEKNIMECDATLGIINTTIDQAIEISKQQGCYVLFYFNDVPMIIDKHTNSKHALTWYYKHFR